ncbi:MULTISPECIES: hypothetical protein [Sorangium]|uniref:Uncharacterized protein n=1 Tax=Sorangium cellulosum TaxID=56 RepID=A0A4P2R0F2_SORCE|nr:MULTISPECIES: hypothetical protein [Sorangium]AUX36379.1 hypothetical protein SOCE836_085860 [Sorangium cellulosum]WCQ95678.1 hypothetical protein NQZ70_08455 [Sorangium sp. Soce836]
MEDGTKPRRAVVPSAPPIPLVIVAGCPAEFVAVCREVGAQLGVAVRECDLRSLRPTIAASQPYAVIVTEDLYRFEPASFDAIIRQAPASLVRIDSREAHDDAMRRLLIDAIFESAAAEPGSGIRAILT